MDPTIQHIIPVDSFSTDDREPVTLDMYSNPNREVFMPEFKLHYTNSLPTSEYITTTVKRSLDTIKKGYAKYDLSTWLRLRKEANPFDLPGNSIFINRAAIKLANIDAVYGLTPNFTPAYSNNYVAPSNIPVGKWSFADIAGGPGSFSQYLMFRMPGAVGYGITLADPKDPSLGWDPLVANQINVIVGDDGSGDLFKHSGYFGRRVLEINGEGVDVAVADGAIGGDEENPKQEIDNFGLITAELLSIMLCLKPGGKFICKIFEAETRAMAQLIYLLSLNFEFIDIFKPIASRPANAERYLIGLNKLPHRYDMIKHLQKVLNYINTEPGKRVTRTIGNELPVDFTQWLTRKNDIHANLQITVGHYIEQAAKGTISVPKYNMYKAYVLWNIPDNQEEYYKIPRKSKYYKYEMEGVEEVDTMIFRELRRLSYAQQLIQKVAEQLAKFYNKGGGNLTNATRFVSMYLLDHLAKNDFHAVDIVFPSGTFHDDKRYYDYLRHLSNDAVNSERSTEWFKSLEIRKMCNEFANRIAAMPVSSYRYNIKKEATDKGIRYTYYASRDNKKSFIITQNMDIKLNGLLQQQYKSRNKEYIFLLLLRYFGVLNSGNHQLGIPDYHTIIPIFKIKEELFASPFNCTVTNGYHSAFPDTDKPFGSLGKFVDTVPESGNGYSVNPPYTDIVMQLAMEKIVQWLNTKENLLFYITIPVWGREEQLSINVDVGDIYPEYVALNVLKKSGFIKAIRTFHRDTFTYIDHNTGQLVAAGNTHIIIAANHELSPEQVAYMQTR